MEGSERLIHAYMAALSLTAVLVAMRRRDGRLKLGFSLDPGRRVRELAAQHSEPVDLVAELWTIESKDAARIAEKTVKNLRAAGRMESEGWFCSIDPGTVREEIVTTAQWFGCKMRNTDEVRAAAAAATGVLNNRLHAMRASGDLQAVNRSYRDYRQHCLAGGKSAMRYAAWIWLFKLKMAREMARESRVTFGKLPVTFPVTLPVTGGFI